MKKKIVTLGLFMIIIGIMITGCKEDDEKNGTLPIITIPEIVKNQKAVKSPERKLVEVGFNNNELVFTHKIGEIKNAFAGFLTMAMYYNGVSEAKIEFDHSTAITNAEYYSVTNIEYNTITDGFSVKASVGKTLLGLDFSLEAGYNWSSTSTRGTVTTYGNSITTQITKTSRYSYNLTPEMEAGYYVIIGIADYIVYQISRIDVNTKKSAGDPEFFFAVPANQPEMILYLVRENDADFSFDNIFNEKDPVISRITNITQDEINKALLYAKEKAKREYEVTWGNNFSQEGMLLTSNWHVYEKLDTFFESNGGIIKNIPINFLKACGFNKFGVRLNYSWSSNDKSNIEMQFKFVNKTTGEQFGETSNTTGSFTFGGTNNKFDLSKLQNGETVVIDARHRKKNAWGNSGGVTINKDRKYTIIIE